MVDVSGAKPVAEGMVARVAAPGPVVRFVAASAAQSSSSTLTSTFGDVAQAGGLAQTMAASAPVDTDRVATIKKAIADGNFPLVPATIADRLIALKLQWHPTDGSQHDQG
jgi:negative regulator of flagellin synthesis FlgM